MGLEAILTGTTGIGAVLMFVLYVLCVSYFWITALWHIKQSLSQTVAHRAHAHIGAAVVYMLFLIALAV